MILRLVPHMQKKNNLPIDPASISKVTFMTNPQAIAIAGFQKSSSKSSAPFPFPRQASKRRCQPKSTFQPTHVFATLFGGRQPATFKVFQFEGGPPTSATIFSIWSRVSGKKRAPVKLGWTWSHCRKIPSGYLFCFKTYSLQKIKV